MKPTRPLTDSELEAWENSRNLETELLESVRQMIARKGRVVFSQGTFVKKKITDNNSSV
jgi:putative transcriptional regulator